MQIATEQNPKRLPAGEYVVIDPCYVYGEDDNFWQHFVDLLYKDRDDFVDGYFEIDGHLIYCFGTKWGDGIYPVYEKGNEIGTCGVDAGMLALIPASVVTNDRLGVHIRLDRPLRPSEWDEGNIKIGDYEIKTSGFDEPEDEDEDDDDEKEYDDYRVDDLW